MTSWRGLFEALKPEDMPRKISTFPAMMQKLLARATYKTPVSVNYRAPKWSKYKSTLTCAKKQRPPLWEGPDPAGPRPRRGQCGTSSLATVHLWGTARALAKDGFSSVCPFYFWVMFRRLVTISLFHCLGSWHCDMSRECVSSSWRGPESTPIGPGCAIQ